MARIMNTENLDYLRGKVEGLIIGRLYMNSINPNKKIVSEVFWENCLSDMIDETIKKMIKILENKSGDK